MGEAMAAEERKVGITVGLNNDTGAGFEEIKRDARDVAQTVTKAGQDAAKGISQIGAGGEQAAQKLDTSAKSIIGSIQRATAAAEAGEKGTAKYYEVIGRNRGIGADVLEPYLAQLRAVETAQAAASASMGNMGMSAKATAAAMRGAPAQISDIFVSLQGGMPVMTVFFQQGLQLRDMFGGFAAAGKALGATLLGMVNPLTIAGAGAVALGAAYYQGSKEVDALRMALVTTGNMTGASVTQLRQFAAEMGAISGAEAKASDALADFVAAGVRGTATLKEYAQTAIDWEKATGTSVEKTAKAFAQLQDDPLKAALELHKGMNFLTLATYEQARALEEQGKKSEAAALLQREYAKALNQGTAEIRTNLGFLESSWEKLGKTASAVWGLMLGAGRSATLADKLAGVRDDIAGMERQLAQGSGFGNTGGGAATGRGTARLTQQDTDALKERIRLRKEELAEMQKQGDQEKADAERKAAEGKAVQDRAKAREEFQSKYSSAIKKELTLQQELEQFRADAAKAGATSEEIRQGEQSIREDHLKKMAAATKAQTKDLAEQQKVYADLAGVSSTYYKDLANAQKQLESGTLSQAQYVKYVEDLIQKQPFAIALIKQETEATDARVRAWQEEVKAQEKLLAQRIRAAEQTEAAVRRAKEEEEAHVLAAAAGISHAEALARIALARAEDNYQKELSKGVDSETLAALQREVEARRELLGLMQQKGVREANKKAADDAAKDWDKTAQTISRTLSDYIMSGGKDAAQYLKRLFANLVLEPIVQYGVSSLMGMGGQAAGVASGGVNPLGMLSGGKSAMGLFGGGAGAGFMNGLSAWGSGGSVTGVLSNPGLYTGAELLGTVAPILLGGIALFKILSGDWFGSRGANHAGAAYSTTGVGNDKAAEMLFGRAGGDWYDDLTKRNSPELGKQLGVTVDSLAQMYKTLGKIAGGSVRDIDIVAGFAANPKHADEDAYGYFKLIDKITGETLKEYTKRDGDLGTDPQKAWAQFVGDMGGALVAEIKKGDIPGWMREELDALGEDVTVEGLTAAIQKIAVIDASFKSWANTLVGFNDINAKAQTALLKTSGGIEALTNNVNAFYAGFYSEAERAEILQRQVREQLKGLGVDIDPKGGEEAKKKFRKLIEDALASGNTELAAKLLALAQLFGVAADAAQKAAETAADAAKTAADEAARALEEAKQKAKDAALANFEAAVAREQEYWQGIASSSQEAINSLSSALNTLKSNARDLYGSVDATKQMLAVQGMVYIEEALAGVRAGAKLSNYGGLSDAISAARGGISSGVYATQFDRERDALVLAGQLSDLADKGDAQLSIEERALKNSQEQLERLDKTLSYWRDLLDDSKAQIDATLSVEAAIKALEKLLFPEKPSSGSGPTPGKGGATAGPGGDESGFVGYQVDLEKGTIRYADGSGHTMSPEELHYYKLLRESGQLPDANIVKPGSTGAQSGGGSSGGRGATPGPIGDESGFVGYKLDLDKGSITYADGSGHVMSPEELHWYKVMQAQGWIPSYDVGSNYIDRDQLAMVHKGEAIIPEAFNPWAGGSMPSVGSGRSDALLERLLSAVERLDAHVAEVAERVTAIQEQGDDVTEGGNAMRTEVMNVAALAQAIAKEMA